MDPLTTSATPPPTPRHPWHNDDGEPSAKIAVFHVTQWLIELGASAKIASCCAYAIASELEDRGNP